MEPRYAIAAGLDKKVHAPDYAIAAAAGDDNCVTKWYSFEAFSTAALKAKVGANSQPTRVEAVSAFI